MQRTELPETGLETRPHFIGSWNLKAPALCDELIAYFEANQLHHTKGKTAGGLNVDAKNSTDMSIRPGELQDEGSAVIRRYLDALFSCYEDYLEQWPFLQSVLARVDIGSFNLQRYDPGGHFQKVHSERTTLSTAHRVLAWMTYLNDVTDGGATHFTHQDISVQPRQGLTLIWPAEWTHAHSGQVLNSGKKYIITGWMNFVPRETAASGNAT